MHSMKTFGSGGFNEMGSRMQRNIHFEVMQKKIESEISKTQLRKKTKGIIDNEINKQVIYEKKTRRWLQKTGKEDVLDFTDEEIAKLRECFDALDDDLSGAIGIEELEGPLIGLGFYDNRDQVIEMIDSVDDDNSGQIEFREFCLLIKNANKN